LTASNNTEIEELVRIASQQKSPEADRRLFLALRRVELFFPRTVVEREGKQLNATPLLRLPDGQHAMMLYTSKDHPDLPDTFGGGAFEDALAAALKMPDLDWVIVSNNAAQWVAIGKEQISAILDDLHSYGQDEGKSFANPEGDSAGKMLEDLITLAVNAPLEELSPPIGSVLRGREVFLELSERQSEEGRPIMHTFRIENLPRLVRAYTTRTRPGISYGGIRWEELKDMIKTAPELDGVQVINQADDWVVFDRQSLGLNASCES
jgi:hypothetical protein